MPDQQNLQDRLRGYKDALAKTPDIKITRVVDIQGDPRIAFDTTTQIVGKERDKVDGFVCLEAQSGKEVAGVLNSYQRAAEKLSSPWTPIRKRSTGFRRA